MPPRTGTISCAHRLGLGVRLSALQTITIAAGTSVLYLLYVFLLPHVLRLHLRTDLSWYDLGMYGFGPSKGYVSFEFESPVVEITEAGSGCDPRYTFLGPRGDSVAHPGPMILDAQGNLVWMKYNWEMTQDFRVQRYQDADYLTYWEGAEIEGRGFGSWYMLDSTYTIQHIVTPAGNFAGDLHEFHITPNGTALVTIYDATLMDLTPIGGPELGWIFDCVFQELDIATGDLIFEWRASDHFPINSTYQPLEAGTGKEPASAFDFFHMNSLDQDDEGNYIVSARHTHTVSCIDRHSGEILWNLGGKMNEFRDLSGGEAASFAWQHDARWHANNTLTLFDNAAHGHKDPERESRGVVLQLDIPRREVTLKVAYYHPQRFKSVSQGNMQRLDDSGRVVIGWGHSAAYSEYSADGALLCDVHFGASAFFSFGRVVSYRALKGQWVGYPQTPPDAEILGDLVYVSWNGATEVVSWRLEALDFDDPDDFDESRFDIIDEFRKTGFETEIKIPDDLNSPILRLAALDSQGNVLGVTDLLQQDLGVDLDELLNLHYWIIGVAFFTSACGLVAGLSRILGCCRCQHRRRWRSNEYQLVPFSGDERRSA